MVGGMSAAAVEKEAIQVEALQWCEHLTLRHETKSLGKVKSRT